MSQSTFHCLNQEALLELFAEAKIHVCYASPGVHDRVAEALLHAGEEIGWDKVRVIIDPDPLVIQLGYGTESALTQLKESQISVRVAHGLRIGIVVTDQYAGIFVPTPLILENFPKDPNIPNAIRVSQPEADRLIRAVAPDIENKNTEEIPEIGKEGLTLDHMKNVKETLLMSPPVAPDFARRMRVINSHLQIIKITFKGAKLSQRSLKLSAGQLGIEDEKLRRQISGRFQLFESGVDWHTSELQASLNKIKERYHLVPVPDIGHAFQLKYRSGLERDLDALKKKLESTRQQLIKEIGEELEESKKRLEDFLKSGLEDLHLDQGDLERRIRRIMYRLKFPEAMTLVSNLSCDWYILNVSEQMIEKEDFRERIKKQLGKSIDELIKIEKALGVKDDPIS